MPRLAKYSKYKKIAQVFENVPDTYLQAIEYGGISYMLDTYFPTREKEMKALQLSFVLLVYEHVLFSYGPETTTKLNGVF